MFCTKCGSEVNQGAKFCGKCGNATEAKVVIPQNNFEGRPTQNNQAVPIKYAGFWIRYAVAFLDGIITSVIGVAISAILFLFAPLFGGSDSGGFNFFVGLLVLVAPLVY